MRKQLRAISILLTIMILNASAAWAACDFSGSPLQIPNGGENWSGTQTITWDSGVCDAGEGLIVKYKSGGCTDVNTDYTIIPTCNDVLASDGSCSWDTTTVVDGTDYCVWAQQTGFPAEHDRSNDTFTIDNTPPAILESDVSLDTTACTGTGGTCKIGDTVKVLVDVSGDTSIESIVFTSAAAGDVLYDLSSAVTNAFSDDGTGADTTASDGVWSANFIVEDSASLSGSADNAAYGIEVTLADFATNTQTITSATNTLDVDNERPALAETIISILGTSDPTVAGDATVYNPTDVVDIEVDVSGLAAEAAGSSVAWSGTSATDVGVLTQDFIDDGATAPDDDGAGVNGAWSSRITVAAGLIDDSAYGFETVITDDAGNTQTLQATTNTISVDNKPLTVTAANIAISGATGTGGAYKIGDTVNVTWNSNATGDNNDDVSSATIDFTEFGGGAIAAVDDGSICGDIAADNIWTSCYTIVAGAIDLNDRNVFVTATDDSSNVVGPVEDDAGAVVDNEAPTITTPGTVTLTDNAPATGIAAVGDALTYADGTEGTGDTVTWSVDLSTYAMSATVAAADGSQTIVADDDDGAFAATENVTDDAGNVVSGATTAVGFVNIDNELPVITVPGTLAVSTNNVGGANAAITDGITYSAGTESTGDAATWTIDLSTIALGASVATGAEQAVVADDDNDPAMNFTETVTDDAGNSVTGTSGSLDIDNTIPAVTAIDVSDAIILESDVGSQMTVNVTFDESMDNTTSPTIVFAADIVASGTLTFNSGAWSAGDTIYTATYDIADANEETLNVDITASAGTDDAGNVQTVPFTSAAAIDVDTVAPTVTGVVISDLTITDADAGNQVTVQVTYTEALDNTISPTLTFAGDIVTSGTLTFNSGAWSAGDTIYTATYDIADVGEEQLSVNVTTSTGQDLLGNVQINDTQIGVIDVDTLNPVVTVNYLNTTDSTPELNGTLDDTTATLTVTVAGTPYVGTNNADGTWTLADDTIAPALADGIYDVAVVATDVFGNTGSDSTTDEVIVDTTSSATSGPEAAPNPVTAGQMVTFTGRIDDGFQVAEANVTVLKNNTIVGVWAMNASDGAFDETVEEVEASVSTTGWTAGTYQFYVLGKDASGNWETRNADNTDTFVVVASTADNVSPSGTVTTTAATVNADYYAISGTLTADADEVTITISDGSADVGTTVVLNGNTAWSVVVPLPQNTATTYTANAEDESGNRAALGSVTITEDSSLGADTTAPTLTVTSPAGPVTVDQEDYKIAGTIGADTTNVYVTIYSDEDASGNVTAGDVALQTNVLTAGITNWEFYVGLQQNSANNFVVEAYDVSGNDVEAAVPAITDDNSNADTTPPAGTVTSTATTVDSDVYSVEGTITAETEPITVTINNGSADVGSTIVAPGSTQWAVVVALPQGTATTFTANANDGSGNSAALGSVTITESGSDSNAPVVTYAGTGTTTTTYTNNGTNYPILDNQVTTSEISIPGNENVEIKNLDVYVGLSHTWINDLKVVVIGPDGTNHTLHEYTGGSADDIYQWYNGITDFNGKNTAGTWTLYVRDDAGGDTGAIEDFMLKITHPAVASDSTQLSVTTDETATCYYGTSDSDTSMMTQMATTSSTSHSQPLTGLTAGTNYQYYIRCTDGQGNEMSSSAIIEFTTPGAVDITAPNGTVTTNAATVNADYHVISGTLTADTDDITITLNNGTHDVGSTTVTAGNTAWSVIVPLPQNTATTFTATATDESGNSAVLGTVTITEDGSLGADTTAPTLTVTSPATTVTVNADTYNVQGTIGPETEDTYLTMYKDADDSGNVTVGDTAIGTIILPPSTTAWQFTVPLEQDTDNNFVVEAHDESYNRVSAGVNTITENSTTDESAPRILSSSPSGIYTADAQPDLAVTTDEPATCKYDTSYVAYGSMANTMTGAGTTSHTVDLGTVNDDTYTYFVACQDTSGNTKEFMITFKVDTTGLFDYVQDLNLNWNTLWIPEPGLLATMMGVAQSDANLALNNVLDPSINGNYNVVWYNVDGTTSGWRWYQPGVPASTLSHANNVNDKPYWIKMTTADRFEVQ